jgi:hypothetical protein
MTADYVALRTPSAVSTSSSSTMDPICEGLYFSPRTLAVVVALVNFVGTNPEIF